MACSSGKLELVKSLLKNGADVNASNVKLKEYNSFYYAFKNDHLDVCQFLIDNNCNPQIVVEHIIDTKKFKEKINFLLKNKDYLLPHNCYILSLSGEINNYFTNLNVVVYNLLIHKKIEEVEHLGIILNKDFSIRIISYLSETNNIREDEKVKRSILLRDYKFKQLL